MTIDTTMPYKKIEMHNTEKQIKDIQTLVSTKQEIKKDSVEISREGRMAVIHRMEVNEGEFSTIEEHAVEEKYGTPSSVQDKIFMNAEDYLFYVLYEKMGYSDKDTSNVSKLLGNLIFHENNQRGPTALNKVWTSDTRDTIGTYVTRADDREIGRNLAEYIAEKYFDDPKEAQAFMDKINEFIKRDEEADEGWMWHDMHREYIESQKRKYYESLKENAKPVKDGQMPVVHIFTPILTAEYKKSIFANAKLITDFSSNEKWNLVKSLLP